MAVDFGGQILAVALSVLRIMPHQYLVACIVAFFTRRAKSVRLMS